jgi:ATP-dependent Lhr-like helicase
LLDALWDLVWATEVTNDTFAPLRALRWPRSGRGRQAPARPRFRAAARMSPPEAAGRWSLVTRGTAPDTERRHALATRLLDLYGVVTRDAVASEAISGGFAQVYPVLREMEERGRVRRGYFVEGLGGAQFALPAALDRLRSERADAGGANGAGPPEAVLLAAADPANPYGAALPWPRLSDDDRRPLPRVAGAYVVLVAGEPVLYLERGGRSLQTLPSFSGTASAESAVAALTTLVADGRVRSLQIERVDGLPVAESRARELLAAAGFRPGYRGWLLRSEAGRV